MPMRRPISRSIPLAIAAILLLAPSAFAARGILLRRHARRGHELERPALGQGEQERRVHARHRAEQALHARARRSPRACAQEPRQHRFSCVSSACARTRATGSASPAGRKRSAVGTFVTAPKPKQNATIEFAWSGDQDFNPEPGKTAPFWNDGGVLRRMKAERNNFNVMLGDTIYSDSEVPGRLNPIALSVAQKWAKYKVNLGNRSLQALRRSAGFYSQWDDHEFVNDFSPAENSFDNDVNVNGRTLYKRGAQAFRDYAPVSWSNRNGLYRSFRWGTQPRGVLPRRALLPERERGRQPRLRQPADRSPGRGADRAADHAQPVRARDSVAGGAGVPGLPRRDPQPEPHLPRQAAARALPARREALQRALQGDHERDADPAVLRPPVRPLGGIRGRAPAAAARASEREERDLPDHRRARDARERRPLPDAGERRRPRTAGSWT